MSKAGKIILFSSLTVGLALTACNQDNSKSKANIFFGKWNVFYSADTFSPTQKFWANEKYILVSQYGGEFRATMNEYKIKQDSLFLKRVASHHDDWGSTNIFNNETFLPYFTIESIKDKEIILKYIPIDITNYPDTDTTLYGDGASQSQTGFMFFVKPNVKIKIIKVEETIPKLTLTKKFIEDTLRLEWYRFRQKEEEQGK